ncbi:MAG: hypothetical protein JNM64_17640, partial [Chloroflexia bacterium]|nr:hypothetical protein [Chloroflexia bacterium]
MAHAEELLANPTTRAAAGEPARVENWRTTPWAARIGGFPWPVVPFLIFCLILEIIPMTILIRDSLREMGVGAYTLSNYGAVTESLYWHSLRNSILLSGGTAILGAIWGGLVAAAIVQSSGRAQRW